MYPALDKIIYDALLADRRPPTGKLHCSSHSHWPLRYTQLSQVFDKPETDVGSLMTMKLGTLTHKWLEEYFEAHPEVLGDEWVLSATELDLTDRLPEPWTGTCDYVFFHKPTKTWCVSDLKTAKPESLAYLNGEPKRDHWIQVSCYRAAIEPGVSLMSDDISVCYLPKGKDSRNNTVHPVVVSKKAMSRKSVWDRLNIISERVQQYKDEYKRTGDPLNKYLASMPPAEAKIGWNKSQGVWDVTLREGWETEYIGSQYPEYLVPRRPSQKVGHYAQGFYIPRKGVVQPDNIPTLTEEQMRR